MTEKETPCTLDWLPSCVFEHLYNTLDFKSRLRLSSSAKRFRNKHFECETCVKITLPLPAHDSDLLGARELAEVHLKYRHIKELRINTTPVEGGGDANLHQPLVAQNYANEYVAHGHEALHQLERLSIKSSCTLTTSTVTSFLRAVPSKQGRSTLRALFLRCCKRKLPISEPDRLLFDAIAAHSNLQILSYTCNDLCTYQGEVVKELGQLTQQFIATVSRLPQLRVLGLPEQLLDKDYPLLAAAAPQVQVLAINPDSLFGFDRFRFGQVDAFVAETEPETVMPTVTTLVHGNSGYWGSGAGAAAADYDCGGDDDGGEDNVPPPLGRSGINIFWPAFYPRDAALFPNLEVLKGYGILVRLFAGCNFATGQPQLLPQLLQRLGNCAHAWGLQLCFPQYHWPPLDVTSSGQEQEPWSHLLAPGAFPTVQNLLLHELPGLTISTHEGATPERVLSAAACVAAAVPNTRVLHTAVTAVETLPAMVAHLPHLEHVYLGDDSELGVDAHVEHYGKLASAAMDLAMAVEASRPLTVHMWHPIPASHYEHHNAELVSSGRAARIITWND